VIKYIVLSMIALLVSVIALLVSFRMYQLSKRVQLSRPHSDRLKDMFKSWLKSNGFAYKVMDITNIPEDSITISIQESKLDSSLLPFARQHLETGYPQISSGLEDLDKQIKEHNESAKRLSERLVEECKEKLGLPEEYPGNQYAHYRRIVRLTLKEIIDGNGKKPKIKPTQSGRHVYYELTWYGQGLIQSSKEDCKNGQRLIKEMLTRGETAKKAKSVQEKAGELDMKRQAIREEMHSKIIDNIEVGGVIKGECDVCEEWSSLRHFFLSLKAKIG